MKQILVIGFSLFLCLSLIQTSLAGNLGSMMGSVKVAKQVNGTISSIDTDSMTITLKEAVEGKEVENKYVFDKYTSVKKGEAIKTIADLNKGDEIILIYVRNGKNNLTKKITIGKE
ncbi:MAG: hypothetical protein RDU01_07740 [Thermodesulfovibrionales bacterium]|nr:hypothetical protein [Thermodesulfovibrionales bacterium]